MRAEKQFLIKEVRDQVAGSTYVLLTDYTGLTVGQFAELRKRLRAAQAECHVVKNSVMRLVLKEAGLPSADGALAGMTAMVIGKNKSDISAAAKVLKNFKKEFEKPKFKLGVMNQQVLQPAEVEAIADLPGLDMLRAQLIGLLQTPATRIAVVLGAPASQIARVLKAHAEKTRRSGGGRGSRVKQKPTVPRRRRGFRARIVPGLRRTRRYRLKGHDHGSGPRCISGKIEPVDGAGSRATIKETGREMGRQRRGTSRGGGSSGKRRRLRRRKRRRRLTSC